MIETAKQGESVAQLVRPKEEPVLKMRKHSRMGGSVPVWETQKTAKDGVEAKLANASQKSDEAFKSALAYADDNSLSDSGPEPFGFGDLVDMVNPLQHIPIVGHVYRHVTGDEIRPISKIMGGTLYGGPAGGAMGLADTIVQHETGRDVAGNAIHMVNGGSVDLKSTPDHPEKRLEQASRSLEQSDHSDLPGTALSFVDLGYGKREVTEYRKVADGRTAGTMMHRYTEVAMPEPAREPVQRVTLQPMPSRHDFSFNS